MPALQRVADAFVGVAAEDVVDALREVLVGQRHLRRHAEVAHDEHHGAVLGLAQVAHPVGHALGRLRQGDAAAVGGCLPTGERRIVVRQHTDLHATAFQHVEGSEEMVANHVVAHRIPRLIRVVHVGAHHRGGVLGGDLQQPFLAEDDLPVARHEDVVPESVHRRDRRLPAGELHPPAALEAVAVVDDDRVRILLPDLLEEGLHPGHAARRYTGCPSSR